MHNYQKHLKQNHFESNMIVCQSHKHNYLYNRTLFMMLFCGHMLLFILYLFLFIFELLNNHSIGKL